MREDLGVMLGATINLISEEMDQRAQINIDFGVNNVPTVEEAAKAVDEAIQQVINMTGHKDWRVTRLSDFGFADSNMLRWPPKQ